MTLHIVDTPFDKLSSKRSLCGGRSEEWTILFGPEQRWNQVPNLHPGCRKWTFKKHSPGWSYALSAVTVPIMIKFACSANSFVDCRVILDLLHLD